VIRCHQRIFYNGVLIYFHRSILRSTPQDLDGYISTICYDVAVYPTFGGGHVTLWPVFMADVVVYDECHKIVVRAWLDEEDRVGAASRREVRMLNEEVWWRRQ